MAFSWLNCRNTNRGRTHAVRPKLEGRGSMKLGRRPYMKENWEGGGGLRPLCWLLYMCVGVCVCRSCLRKCYMSTQVDCLPSTLGTPGLQMERGAGGGRGGEGGSPPSMQFPFILEPSRFGGSPRFSLEERKPTPVPPLLPPPPLAF